MKPTKVALLAACGMLFSSVSVYSLTPPGGLHATADKPAQYFSYLAVLIRENGKLRIRSEIEFPENQES